MLFLLLLPGPFWWVGRLWISPLLMALKNLNHKRELKYQVSLKKWPLCFGWYFDTFLFHLSMNWKWDKDASLLNFILLDFFWLQFSVVALRIVHLFDVSLLLFMCNNLFIAVGFIIKRNKLPVSSCADATSHGLLLSTVFCAYQSSQGKNFSPFYWLFG